MQSKEITKKKKKIKEVQVMVPLEKLRVGDIEVESATYDAFDLASIIKSILKEEIIKEYLELYKKKKMTNSYTG